MRGGTKQAEPLSSCTQAWIQSCEALGSPSSFILDFPSTVPSHSGCRCCA